MSHIGKGSFYSLVDCCRLAIVLQMIWLALSSQPNLQTSGGYFFWYFLSLLPTSRFSFFILFSSSRSTLSCKFCGYVPNQPHDRVSPVKQQKETQNQKPKPKSPKHKKKTQTKKSKFALVRPLRRGELEDLKPLKVPTTLNTSTQKMMVKNHPFVRWNARSAWTKR